MRRSCRRGWLACCFREENLEVLQHHGAVSTAAALQRLGHADLADRLVAWAYRNDPAGAMELFEATLRAAGLERRDDVELDDLDTLLGEVFAVADELDRGAP